jgi:hypothetical protein
MVEEQQEEKRDSTIPLPQREEEGYAKSKPAQKLQ